MTIHSCYAYQTGMTITVFAPVIVYFFTYQVNKLVVFIWKNPTLSLDIASTTILTYPYRAYILCKDIVNSLFDSGIDAVIVLIIVNLQGVEADYCYCRAFAVIIVVEPHIDVLYIIIIDKICSYFRYCFYNYNYWLMLIRILIKKVRITY